MKQLELTIKELKRVGFVYKNNAWRIPILNGWVYCNRKQPKYKWYIVMGNDSVSNHLHLDITHEAQLITFLQTLRAKHKTFL